MACMSLATTAFWTDHLWSGISLLAAMTVLGCSIADRKRQRRIRMDDVGFMPWTGITVLATLTAVVAAALALKGA
jgi:hypothetical protein